MKLKTKFSESIIEIEDGAVNRIGEVCSKSLSAGQVAVISDSNVAPLYASQVLDNISDCGIKAKLFTIPAGEEYKTLQTVSDIYAYLAQNDFSRSDALIALGGGVVGDITGFAAATYLRGIRSVQIPTTLLAQVDSSVGGKCGVDLPYGKNLIGAFNQPNYVLIDPCLLSSLPELIFIDGMAEVIKYGCIFDLDLFTRLENESPQDFLSELITRCVALKAKVVEKDELDRGERMLLNFGHTIGHAIEKCGNFIKFSHGKAVAIGMAFAAHLGEKIGVTPQGVYNRIDALLKQYGFDTALPYSPDKLISVMSMDKKIINGKLNLILLEALGKARLYPTTIDEIMRIVRK